MNIDGVMHEPYNDDGALYCGWSGDGGTVGGCGEAWPCSAVRGLDDSVLAAESQPQAPPPGVDKPCIPEVLGGVLPSNQLAADYNDLANRYAIRGALLDQIESALLKSGRDTTASRYAKAVGILVDSGWRARPNPRLAGRSNDEPTDDLAYQFYNGVGDKCAFCQRIKAGDYEETELYNVVSFVPLNPVTPGHRLFVPRTHVTDALADTLITADVFDAAARRGVGALNLITSVGAPATQTVRHLHVHYVPRREGDGLPLPWTGQRDFTELTADMQSLTDDIEAVRAENIALNERWAQDRARLEAVTTELAEAQRRIDHEIGRANAWYLASDTWMQRAEAAEAETLRLTTELAASNEEWTKHAAELYQTGLQWMRDAGDARAETLRLRAAITELISEPFHSYDTRDMGRAYHADSVDDLLESLAAVLGGTPT